jgi:hypothetical protein
VKANKTPNIKALSSNATSAYNFFHQRMENQKQIKRIKKYISKLKKETNKKRGWLGDGEGEDTACVLCKIAI